MTKVITMDDDEKEVVRILGHPTLHGNDSYSWLVGLLVLIAIMLAMMSCALSTNVPGHRTDPGVTVVQPAPVRVPLPVRPILDASTLPAEDAGQ
jgi:hypothetical protein